jgi:hypothetical protein
MPDLSKRHSITISAKCSDLFNASIADKDGNELAEYRGYVPDFFPGEHWGDYVILEIELATGRILNWMPPTDEQLETPRADNPKAQFTAATEDE